MNIVKASIISRKKKVFVKYIYFYLYIFIYLQYIIHKYYIIYILKLGECVCIEILQVEVFKLYC